jgi:putative ABC transport system permease protein
MYKYFCCIVTNSFNDLKNNKIRTILTSLGIFIGISSVVLLMAFGLGLKKYIELQFEAIGANLVMVMPGRMMQSGSINPSSMSIQGKFDDKDYQRIKKIENIAVSAPAYHFYPEIKGYKDTRVYELIASTPDIFNILNMVVEMGVLFDENHNEKAKKVVVLGSAVAKNLFSTKDQALNKIVKINDQPYLVIGVLESKGGGGGGMPSIDDHILTPFKSTLSFNPSKKYYGIYAKLKNEDRLETTKTDIKNILLKRYNESDFSVLDQKEIFNSMESIFNMVNYVLVGIATISLMVGGIGIMNIMYVSVAQRVQEIGIRRAYGAKRRDILLLFLTQSIILSMLGGVLGLCFSFLVVILIQSYFPAYINFNTVFLAVFVSASIGIFFGVVPAKKASEMTPVEAIRR